MALDARFHFVRFDGGDQSRPPQLRERVLARLAPAVEASGGSLWGTWAGIFGVGTNELIAIVSFPADATDPREVLHAAFEDSDDASIASDYALTPTVRPADRAQITREGLYVFRYFDIDPDRVDDFGELSEAGWVSYESDDAFETMPTGLFVVGSDASDRRTMLLVTWYDGLASWQRSRQFPEGARENFARRGEFTLRSVAYATRLLA